MQNKEAKVFKNFISVTFYEKVVFAVMQWCLCVSIMVLLTGTTLFSMSLSMPSNHEQFGLITWMNFMQLIQDLHSSLWWHANTGSPQNTSIMDTMFVLPVYVSLKVFIIQLLRSTS